MIKNKKIIKIGILLLALIAGLSGCIRLFNSNYKTDKKYENMKNTEFIPKEFNNIKLGYYETSESISFLQYPEGIPMNTIIISTPQKILCHINNKDFVPVIPVCAVYEISLERGLKYAHLSAQMLHIRKLDEETVYSGEIENKNIDYGHPIYPPDYEEEEKERQRMIEEAQKYSDEELDFPGLFEGNVINVNLMEYVDIPFEAGEYEIYLSFSGIESNHTIVEIVIK
jgi:hypothetical protein